MLSLGIGKGERAHYQGTMEDHGLHCEWFTE